MSKAKKQNLIHAIESAQNDKRVYAAMRMRRIMCEGEAASIPASAGAEDVAAITPEALTAHWRIRKAHRSHHAVLRRPPHAAGGRRPCSVRCLTDWSVTPSLPRRRSCAEVETVR